MRLGEYDTSNDIDTQDCVAVIAGGEDCTTGAVVIPIERTIPHPDYDPYDKRTRRHDIALVRTTESAPYTGKSITITVYLTHNRLNVISVWQAAVSN